jgi:hypothetical protein
MKRLLIVCSVIVGIAILVLAWRALDDLIGIPPRGVTWSRMWLTKRRILQYALSHNQLPRSLSDLPIMPGYDNSVDDEWGRPITYEVSPSGVVTLTSLGRDGKVGGSGEDADMIATFPSHDAQGRWSDESVAWSHDPFSQ